MLAHKSIRSGMGVRMMMMAYNTTTTLFGVNTGTNLVAGVVVMCTVTSH